MANKPDSAGAGLHRRVGKTVTGTLPKGSSWVIQSDWMLLLLHKGSLQCTDCIVWTCEYFYNTVKSIFCHFQKNWTVD